MFIVVGVLCIAIKKYNSGKTLKIREKNDRMI